MILLIVIDVFLPPKQRLTAKPAPQTIDLHFWETKCKPLHLPPLFPFSFFQNKDPQPNLLPKPPFSTFVTWNQFFLMIRKSTNLSVTKRKRELNSVDGSLSLFLPKIKLNGFWSLFYLYFINTYYIFIIKSAVFEQAQQWFQRDAQTITPEALESVKATLASNEIEHKAKKVVPCKAADQAWEDSTLADWPKSMNYFTFLIFTMCWYLIYIILRPDLWIYNGCRLIFIIF